MQEEYIKHLKLIGSLSQLFSNSAKPFLYYRIAEFLYIKSFNAKDVTRSDIAVDAIIDGYGVGLKTFQGSNGKSTYQKVAEFNKMRKELEQTRTELGGLDFAKHISSLRNERIKFVSDTFSEVENFKYHCVVRDVGKFTIYEEPMELVDIQNIRLTKDSSSTLHFTDGKHEYNFSISKSTLLKKFYEQNPLYSFEVPILKAPLDELLKKFSDSPLLPKSQISSVVLPLYSTISKTKQVPEHSGLNQWNADGRPRALKEVYIPIPAVIHKLFPDFLPPRKIPFSVTLPDGTRIPVVIAQAGGKALMSNPNTLLGEWLITSSLKIPDGQIVTRELLDRKGIDSVELSKIDGEYYLNLKKTGSYEVFLETYA